MAVYQRLAGFGALNEKAGQSCKFDYLFDEIIQSLLC